MQSNFISAYAFNSFYLPEAQAADLLVSALIHNLELADACAASAKKAVFALKSHQRAYQEVRNQKESKRRRSIIDKNSALSANFQASEYAFRFYGNKVVELRNKLIAILPTLATEAKAHCMSSRTNGIRTSNVVVCQRLVQTLPDVLRAMHADFQPEQRELVWHGGDALISLKSHVLDPKYESDFAAPLSLPYIAGICDRPEFVTLDRCLKELAQLVAQAEIHRSAFEVARSRANNRQHLQSSLATAANSGEAKRILEESDDVLLQYGCTFLATAAARQGIIEAMTKAEEALKAAVTKIYGSREETASGLSNVLGVNMIAAQCMLFEGNEMRRKLYAIEDAHHKAYDLKMVDREAIDSVFQNRPAAYEEPALGFLDCNG